MRKLAFLLFLLALPVYAQTTYVTATLTIANSNGTLPTVTPEGYATVTYMPVASPAMPNLEQKAVYDSTLGTLTFTLPASSQAKFRFPRYPKYNGTYTLPASGTYNLNAAVPTTPATSPGWAASLLPFLVVPAKGTLPVGNGSAWAMLPPGANNYTLTADSTQPNGVKWAPTSAGLPGGSSGQLQFNNAGAFGGVPGTSVNGTTGAMTLTAQAATTTPVVILPAAGQSANLLQVGTAGAPSLQFYVGPNGTSGGIGYWTVIEIDGSPASATITLNAAYGTNTVCNNWATSGTYWGARVNPSFSGTGTTNVGGILVNVTSTGTQSGAKMAQKWQWNSVDIASLDYAGAFTASGTVTAAAVKYSTLPPTYANNAAAVAGGLVAGQTYRTGADPDVLCVVH